jgi:hypothetical protein
MEINMKDIKISIINDLDHGKIEKIVSLASLKHLDKIIQDNLWSCGIFKKRRCKDDFESCQLIALDIDNGCTLEQAKEDFKGYIHLIKPTRNHQKEKGGITCDRFRVILLLDRPITSSEEYKATWNSLFEKFNYIDPSTKDPSRQWFPCPHNYLSISDSGDTVTVQSNLSKSLRQQKKAPCNNKKSNVLKNERLLSKLRPETFHFIFNGADDGEFNEKLNKAAFDCANVGIDKEYFIQVSEKNSRDRAFDKKDLAAITSAYNSSHQHQSNASFRNYIWNSLFITDIEDAKRTYLYREDINEFKQVDASAIIREISAKTFYKDYIPKCGRISNLVYDPRNDNDRLYYDDGEMFFNTYRQPSWMDRLSLKDFSDEVPVLYKEFFIHLTGKDESSYEYLLDWLANSVQSRNRTILVAIGEQGIGKGVLGDIMRILHGDRNFSKTTDGVFKERFNGPLLYKTLVHVDEIKIGDNDVAYNRLKDVVNDYIQIEEKCKNQKEIENHASFYICSNNLNAIPLEEGQRRFSLIQLTEQKLYESGMVSKHGATEDLVAELLDEDNIKLLGAALLKRKIDQTKMIRPFESTKLQDLKMANLKEWEEWFIFTWCPQNYKACGNNIFNYEEEVKSKITNAIPDLKSAPGREKMKALCKKYPTVFNFRRIGSRRFVEILEGASNIAKNEKVQTTRANQELLDTDEQITEEFRSLDGA